MMRINIILERLYGPYLYLKSLKNYILNSWRYETAPNPFETIKINPGSVSFRVPSTSLKRDGLGNVKNGKWDKHKNLKPVDEHFMVRGLTERFEQCKDWENTAYFNWAKRKLEVQDTVWGCENIDEFRIDRCSYVDGLFEDIKNNGYKSNRELSKKQRYSGKGLQYLEPLVMIGRKGEIFMRDGYHRFTIARILDINIPVLVQRRHEKWQEVRDSALSGTLPQHVESNHPDLQDIC